MLLYIANSARWPKRPEHNGDVQSIDSRLPPGNPKLLVDVDSSSKKLTLLQKCQRSKGEYRRYSASLRFQGVVCVKPTLFSKPERGELVYSEYFQRG